MEMKQYLIDTFKYNDFANKKLLEKISSLLDKDYCIKLFSHLINSQIKWMARIKQDPNAQDMNWWEPVYKLEELESNWDKSLKSWVSYLESLSKEEIEEKVSFIGFDGGCWEAKLLDIALQLNYHSIHHRAQMQTIIRQQGLTPDFLDYIGTVYKKLS
ncbi:MAG TPA: DinB family protein [Saprospiraceae bacterium]|nr:DinB family protein [Saprospiraceae bacterium]